MGMTDWVLGMIHYRLRSLGVSQIEDLIRHADTEDSLKIIMKHLESNDFKYALVGLKAKELKAICATRAEHIRLKQTLVELKPAANDLIGLIKELL